MKRFFLAFLFLFLPLFIIATDSAFAASPLYKVRSSFDVEDDGRASATFIVEASSPSGQPNPTTLDFPIAGLDPDAFVVKYQDGQSLKSNYDEASKSLTIRLPASQLREWSFVLDYSTNITKQLGAITVSQVEGLNFGGMDIASQSVTISTDLSRGVAATIGPAPTDSQLTTGRQYVTWTEKKGPLNQAVGLMFGDQAVAKLDFRANLKNNSWWWQTMTITLPPDTNQQQVFIDSISPEPSSVTLDTDGNVLANYHLAPKQSVDVEAKATVVLNNIVYDLKGNNDSLSAIPQDLVDRYTVATDVWVDGSIQVDTTDKPVIGIVEEVYNEIVKTQSGSVDATSGFDTVKNFSDQLVGELRAGGVPARTIIGTSTSNGNQLFSEAIDHAWVEAYIPHIGWMSIDPYYEIFSDSFGTTDARKIGLVLRGIEDDYPPENLEYVTANYVEEAAPEPVTPIPELSAVKNMVLPGVALFTTKVQMPSGVIYDNAGLDFSGKVVSLGSLAPLQNASVKSLVLFGKAFSSEDVNYGSLGTEGLQETLVSTTSTTSYIPMIVLIILIFASIGLAVVIRKLMRKRHDKRKPPKSTADPDVIAHHELNKELKKEKTDEQTPRQQRMAEKKAPQAAKPKQVQSKVNPVHIPPSLRKTPKSDTMNTDELRNRIRGQIDGEQKPKRKKPPKLIQ